MDNYIIDLKTDLLRTEIKPVNLGILALPGDNQAHTFRISVFNGDMPASLDGASCFLYVKLFDRQVFQIAGTVSGNTARFTLSEDCYSVNGFTHAIARLNNGTQRVTIADLTWETHEDMTMNASIPMKYQPAIEDLEGYIERLDALQISLSEYDRDLIEFNATEFLSKYANPVGRTYNGVNFEWDGLRCTVQGTASGTSFCNITGGSTKLPEFIEPGGTYFFKVDTTDPNIFIRMYSYIIGSSSIYGRYELREDTMVTFPDNLAALNIRVEVVSGANVDGAISVNILNALSNQDLKKYTDENALIAQAAETLSDVDDLNGIHGNGVWSVPESKSNTMLHVPDAFVGQPFWLISTQHKVNNNKRIMQIAIGYDADRRMYRRSGSAGAMTEWREITRHAEVQELERQALKVKNDNALSSCDLNDVTEIGIYLLTETQTYENKPASLTSGFLTCVSAKSRIMQSLISVDGSQGYIRSYNNDVWSAWREQPTNIYKLTFADLDPGKLIRLNLQAVMFNINNRTVADPTFSSKIIRVKKGDIIDLSTTAGSNAAKPYALINDSLLITYTYTDSAKFTGVINVEEDGYIAVNSAVGNASFSLKVYRLDTAEMQRSILFTRPATDGLDLTYKYESDNPCAVLKIGPSMAAAIHHWGVIGASFDSGAFNFTNKDGTTADLDWYEYSWGQCFRRMNAISDLYNYSNGGQKTKDWLTKQNNESRGHAFPADEEVWLSYHDAAHKSPWYGGHGPGGGCWWKMKEDHENGNTKQAFIVVLGSNDIGNHPHDSDWNTLPSYDPTQYYEEGSIEDIGTYDLATDTDTPPAGKTAGDVPGIVNSYAAYMGAILERILAVQPRAIIFLSTIRNNYGQNERSLAVWNRYNSVLRQIAQMDRFKDNVFLIDYGKYGPNYFSASYNLMRYEHPSAMGYQMAAFYYNTLIDDAIMKNLDKIGESEWIGTDRWHPRG